MLRSILFIAILVGTLSASAQQERKYIRQGNREYEKATKDSLKVDSVCYQNAEDDYRKALEKEPNNWGAIYNLANSLYRQKKYDDATKQYMAVAGMENKNSDELAMAYHNLGNSLLQTNKLSEAIEAYKNALRKNPNDFETKYNLAWAQDKLKQQQNQQQNQDQDQDKEDKDQQKDEQQQNKQDQQNQDQQKKDQEKQQQQQSQQQQTEKKDQISKEDAARILEALQNDEKEVKEKVQKQKVQPKKRTTQKDW